MSITRMVQPMFDKPCAIEIEGIGYIEIYIGNAKQAAFYYSKLFGFRITVYRGLETGVRDCASYLLEQGDVRLLISSAYTADHPIATFIKKRGDGVRDIALRVQDVQAAFEQSVTNGAIPIQEPQEEQMSMVSFAGQ